MTQTQTRTPTWDEALHQRIAEAIRKARAGKSAQELADATRALGYPLSRAQIANYESGRKRNLDLAELIVIATALGVAPLDLLFPDAGPVEYLPDQPMSVLDAMTRFIGNRDVAWPGQQVAALTAKLDQIHRAVNLPGRGELRGDAKEKK